MNKKRQSKGSGRKKSLIQSEIRNIDLISQLKNNSTRELAEKYGTSIHSICFEIGEQFKNRRIGFGYTKANDRREEDLECQGAWMTSAERSCYKAVLINYNLYLKKKT